MTTQLDLLGEQRLAGAAIFPAFVGMARRVSAGEFGGWLQGGTGHDGTSLVMGILGFAARRSGKRRSDRLLKISFCLPCSLLQLRRRRAVEHVAPRAFQQI